MCLYPTRDILHVPRAPAIMNYHSLGSEWADVPAPPIPVKSVVPGTADWKPDVGLPAS